jgi:hypothetical protein
MKKIVTLFLLILFGITAGTVQAQTPMPETAGQPLERFLNPDGSLNLKSGFRGSLDPKGYRMRTGKNGQPTFEPVTRSIQSLPQPTAAGDENWSALGSGVNGSVHAIAVSGSDVYVGGDFTTAGGITVNCIAKWNGSAWSALGSGMVGIRPSVGALVFDLSGNLYVGGHFTSAGGVPANYIAKWNGSAWSALGSGMGGSFPDVYALATDSYGNIYAGGRLTTAGGVTVNGIAKWNGSSWNALGSGIDDGGVYAIAVSGSNVYVGGDFTSASGVSANRIAKWNGSSWSALGSGIGTVAYMSDPFVEVLRADESGNLYAGGFFAVAGGITVNYIAKWNGSTWNTLGSGMNDIVHGIVLDGSGNLYAGGWFSTAGGITVNSIAKWNGSSWSALGSGAGSDVHALAVSGYTLYAGGYFTSAGGIAASNIAKYSIPTVPSAPTLASPSNGATGISTSPTLTWNAVTGATGYELQVSTSSGFTTTVVNQTSLTNTSYSASGLSNSTLYYWRVRAKNSAGTGSYSSVWSFTTSSTVSVTTSVTTPGFIPQSPSQSTDYRLFSVPGNSNPLVGSIFYGYQKTGWRVFTDNGNVANYLVELGPEDKLSTGRGVWAMKKGGITVPSLSSQLTLNWDGTYSITVIPNAWNIIGNPFNKNVAWSSVVSANSNSYLMNYGLWEYTGSFQQAGTMEPFKGYYYKTAVGQTSLKIPYPTGTSSVASITAVPVTWQLKLSLETSLNADQENFIGIAPSAQAGLDNLDAAKPPLVFDQGFLYFTHPDWDNYGRFASDFRPSLGDGQTWNFEVHNPQKGSATIRVSGIESLPSGCEVLLVNPVSGTPYDLRKNPAYTYETLTEKMTFKIVVGTSAFVESEIAKDKPSKFGLSQNYPNPFNPTTVIGFQIAKESVVKLEIFNMLGQKVRTLVNEKLGAANYSKVWDGRDASGKRDVLLSSCCR